MGLLDQILAEALGGTQSGGTQSGGMQGGGMQGGAMRGGMQSAPSGQQCNQLLDLAMKFVQNYPGGLAGLVQAITGAGYGRQARSWVGTGQNMQISKDDLSQILGQGNVESMGRGSGLSSDATAGGLAALLPVLIDQLTPKGQVDEQTDLAAALNSLRGRTA